MKDIIGFVGLGLMGMPMAERFLNAGYTVIAYDRCAQRLAQLASLGAKAASSAKQVADHAEVVIGSVPDGVASRAVTLAADGIHQGRRCKYYIETSPIGVQASREIAQQLAQAGKCFIDAPVSGGPRAIKQGSLTALVSAPADALSELAAVFTHLCKEKMVVGTEPGLAQACKLVNNAISLSILQIAAETTVFGVKAGLDPHLLIDAINASSGKSAVTMTKFPASILTRRFDFGASLATGAKDMELFVHEAQAMGLQLDSTPAIAQSWRSASNEGPQRDFTEIIKKFETTAGVEVGRASAPQAVTINAH